jgi:hypothetical protein
MEEVNAKTKVILDIYHYRNGNLINHVKPYENATLFEKLLHFVGLKNLTRSD